MSNALTWYVWCVKQALERVAGLLEGSTGSVTIAERGDLVGVPRHPNFRLLAAMNPATDAGKRDLPAPLRNRFTEVLPCLMFIHPCMATHHHWKLFCHVCCLTLLPSQQLSGWSASGGWGTTQGSEHFPGGGAGSWR